VRAGDLEALKSALDDSTCNINSLSKGNTALMEACQHHNRVPHALELIKCGADVKIIAKSDDPKQEILPLAFCISKNKIEVATALLQAGSPATGWKLCSGIPEITLLHFAIQEGFEDLAILMIDSDENCLKGMSFQSFITGKNPLIEAVDKRFSKLVNKLLQSTPEKWLDVNYKNPKSYNQSALSIATEDNNTEIMKMLKIAGAY